jgi:hypothetical protein
LQFARPNVHPTFNVRQDVGDNLFLEVYVEADLGATQNFPMDFMIRMKAEEVLELSRMLHAEAVRTTRRNLF